MTTYIIATCGNENCCILNSVPIMLGNDRQKVAMNVSAGRL